MCLFFSCIFTYTHKIPVNLPRFNAKVTQLLPNKVCYNSIVERLGNDLVKGANLLTLLILYIDLSFNNHNKK